MSLKRLTKFKQRTLASHVQPKIQMKTSIPPPFLCPFIPKIPEEGETPFWISPFPSSHYSPPTK